MGIVQAEKILALVDNDKGIATSLLQMFIELTPLDYNQLRTFSEQNNIHMIGNIAHKLKSSVATLGMPELSEQLRIIEVNAKSDTGHEMLHKQIILVGTDLDKVYEEMTYLISNGFMPR